MNWVFETYSNVYSAAMMQDVKAVRYHAAPRMTLRQKIARFIKR